MVNNIHLGGILRELGMVWLELGLGPRSTSYTCRRHPIEIWQQVEVQIQWCVLSSVYLHMHDILNHRTAFNSGVFIMSVLAAGTLLQGADFIVWTYIWDNFARLLTSNILLAYFLATYCYLSSFSVKSGNAENRELAAGGHSGNMLYDWFIGRELNPRINIPIIGEIDIKAWMELRPGLLGWVVLDCAFIAAQYRNYGYITDSILIVTAAQGLYVFDAYYMEPAILTTIDIISDGFGFMLAFGDIVWVPFVYSMQTRYLAVHPVMLGWWNILVFSILGLGYAIFRGANNEKNRFRTNPNDPRIKHLESITTKAGTKLLVSGWWGTARHINYLGDWLLSWSYSLPTGLAGYEVYRGAQALAIKAASTVQHGQDLPPGGHQMITPESIVVAPGEARGWGMIVTYFYLIYFAVLLIHRERRDEEKCRRKYGADWQEYTRRVPSRIIPYVY